MPPTNYDFRHRMDCGDCWAREHESGEKPRCLISKENDNRPEGIPEDRSRCSFSGVYDYAVLNQWPCEFRYSRKELKLMKSGDLHIINVSKAVAMKIIKAAESIPGYRIG